MKTSQFETQSISSTNTFVGINPEGGYVSGWKVKQPNSGEFLDILYQGGSQKRTGIPILFPQFSAAKGMRSHGFGRDSHWTVESVKENSATMTLQFANVADDAKQEYPYPFEAKIIVELTDSDSLIYSLNVKNTGASDMPISPGLHPYWAVPHEKKRTIRITRLRGFDAAAFDWDTAPPDNPYDYEEKTIITFPDREISIEDISEPHVINHIVVWSQTSQKEDYNFVCVEPVCGYINALDTSPIRIPPESEWTMKIRFSVRFTA